VSQKAIVIGSGFAGLSAATFLSKYGWQVMLLKNTTKPEEDADISKQKVSLLIWVPAGIGCQMYLNVISRNSIKKFKTIIS
jgi:thioredoxin reductase